MRHRPHWPPFLTVRWVEVAQTLGGAAQTDQPWFGALQPGRPGCRDGSPTSSLGLLDPPCTLVRNAGWPELAATDGRAFTLAAASGDIPPRRDFFPATGEVFPVCRTGSWVVCAGNAEGHQGSVSDGPIYTLRLEVRRSIFAPAEQPAFLPWTASEYGPTISTFPHAAPLWPSGDYAWACC